MQGMNFSTWRGSYYQCLPSPQCGSTLMLNSMRNLAVKYVKYFTLLTILVIAFPLSWVAAWIAGTELTLGLSLILPTYGVIYWGLIELLGAGLLQAVLSWVFGFSGALVTFFSVSLLTREIG
jgi:hypothetical protein